MASSSSGALGTTLIVQWEKSLPYARRPHESRFRMPKRVSRTRHSSRKLPILTVDALQASLQREQACEAQQRAEQRALDLKLENRRLRNDIKVLNGQLRGAQQSSASASAQRPSTSAVDGTEKPRRPPPPLSERFLRTTEPKFRRKKYERPTFKFKADDDKTGSGQAFGSSAPERNCVAMGPRGVPGPGAYTPPMSSNGRLATISKDRGKFNLSKPMGYIERHLYEKKHVPDPGVNQPKGGFSTLTTTGGNFNMSKPMGYIDRHLYEKKHVPDPGVNQPKGGFSTLRKSGGTFNMSKSMGYIDRALYEKRHVPDPGAGQPEGGFSTLKTSGGAFNMSKPMGYIERALYEKRHVPDPGAGQPEGGFSTLNTSGGAFNMSKPMGYIERALYEKRHVPEADYEVRGTVIQKTFNVVLAARQQAALTPAKKRFRKAVRAVTAIRKMNKSFGLLSRLGSPMGLSAMTKIGDETVAKSKADAVSQLKVDAEEVAALPMPTRKQSVGVPADMLERRKSLEAEDIVSVLESKRENDKHMNETQQIADFAEQMEQAAQKVGESDGNQDIRTMSRRFSRSMYEAEDLVSAKNVLTAAAARGRRPSEFEIEAIAQVDTELGVREARHSSDTEAQPRQRSSSMASVQENGQEEESYESVENDEKDKQEEKKEENASERDEHDKQDEQEEGEEEETYESDEHEDITMDEAKANPADEEEEAYESEYDDEQDEAAEAEGADDKHEEKQETKADDDDEYEDDHEDE